eukprot:GEMP01114366.1.p1 GENE.GEMP01114366.1~~GEMP01114366.1.p1  ORF type:complete len:101 (-),score=10.20 GEMP01114366.1:38-340(-)
MEGEPLKNIFSTNFRNGWPAAQCNLERCALGHKQRANSKLPHARLSVVRARGGPRTRTLVVSHECRLGREIRPRLLYVYIVGSYSATDESINDNMFCLFL